MNALPPPQEKALAALFAAMPADLLLSDGEALERYSRDWSGDHYGRPLAVARPRSKEELSLLMRCCHEQQIHVVFNGELYRHRVQVIHAEGRILVVGGRDEPAVGAERDQGDACSHVDTAAPMRGR